MFFFPLGKGMGLRMQSHMFTKWEFSKLILKIEKEKKQNQSKNY